VWKVLSQTVPESFKTEPVVELELYFRELIRGIDSSLLEEWERLRDPDYVAVETGAEKPARPASYDLTRDRPGFRRLVRTAILGFLQDVAARDWDAAAIRATGAGDADAGIARRIENAFQPYFEARERFRLDPEGRSAKHTHLDESDPHTWTVAQVLVDAQEMNDWELVFTVSLPDSRTLDRAALVFVGAGPVGATPMAPG